MKAKIITGLKKEVLVIELPEQWTFNIYKDQIGFCNEINKPIEQIKGCYTLLRSPDEIKEEDVMELVRSGSYTTTFWNHKTNDNHKSNQLKTALESFLSALESEIFWVNPSNNKLDKSKPLIIQIEHLNKWKEAQEKTFDRNRTLIFVKN